MIDVPRLRFAARNAAREEIYSWTAVPPRAALPPGEAVSFRTRLASPPLDAHDVLVRFVNRFDVTVGGITEMARILIAEDEENPGRHVRACACRHRPRGQDGR